MTLTEAQEHFKAQSVALTGHKNIIVNSDIYVIFGGEHLIYRRIKTRCDWFIVKVLTEGGNFWSRNPEDDFITELKIIKVSTKPDRNFSVKQVWNDYNRIIDLVDLDQTWKTSRPYLLQPMDERDIVPLLETSIFKEYKEELDPSSSEYQKITLRTI
jgi:hypothetical protein